MSNLDRPEIISAAAASGTAAVLIFALLPVVTGTMADHFQLDDVQTGLVASSYFSVYALVSLTSFIWIRRLPWHWTTRFGLLALVLGLVLTWIAPDFAMATMGLALAGAGAAFLFPISLTLVSDMENPNRGYAIKMAVEQLVPAALLFLLSSSMFAGFGLSTLLLALLLVVLLCGFFSAAMPRQGAAGKDGARPGGSALLGYGSLLALGVMFAGFAGLWAFLERIAVANQFDTAFTNTWLGVGLITSGVGPLVAVYVEAAMSRFAGLLLGMGVAVLSMALLLGEVGQADYAMVLILLPFSYYFGLTFVFSVVAEADHNGRVAGLMAFALALSSGGGPAAFGWLRSMDAPVVAVMALLIAVGTLLALTIENSINSGSTEKQL